MLVVSPDRLLSKFCYGQKYLLDLGMMGWVKEMQTQRVSTVNILDKLCYELDLAVYTCHMVTGYANWFSN